MSNFGFWRPVDAPKYWKTKHLGIERKNMIEIFDFWLTSTSPQLLSLGTDFSPDLMGGGHEHTSLSWTGRAGTDYATPGLAWPARLPDPVMEWSSLASRLASHLVIWPAIWSATWPAIWSSGQPAKLTCWGRKFGQKKTIKQMKVAKS